jgi:hypothetical protein
MGRAPRQADGARTAEAAAGVAWGQEGPTEERREEVMNEIEIRTRFIMVGMRVPTPRLLEFAELAVGRAVEDAAALGERFPETRRLELADMVATVRAEYGEQVGGQGRHPAGVERAARKAGRGAGDGGGRAVGGAQRVPGDAAGGAGAVRGGPAPLRDGRGRRSEDRRAAGGHVKPAGEGDGRWSRRGAPARGAWGAPRRRRRRRPRPALRASRRRSAG